MNKFLYIGIGIIILAGVVFLVVQNNMKAQDNANVDTQASSENLQAVVVEEKTSSRTVTQDGPRYVEYSKTVLDQSKDLRRVLYFYATWCPSCKAANEDFTANPNKIPEDVVVMRINYNDPNTDQEEKDLAKKYGITYQHTFVQIDGQGEQVAKWNGGKSEELVRNLR